jgi:hypothetical protein
MDVIKTAAKTGLNSCKLTTMQLRISCKTIPVILLRTEPVSTLRILMDISYASKARDVRMSVINLIQMCKKKLTLVKQDY